MLVYNILRVKIKFDRNTSVPVGVKELKETDIFKFSIITSFKKEDFIELELFKNFNLNWDTYKISDMINSWENWIINVRKICEKLFVWWEINFKIAIGVVMLSVDTQAYRGLYMTCYQWTHKQRKVYTLLTAVYFSLFAPQFSFSD